MMQAGVEEAAALAFAGIDPMRYLDCRDPRQRGFMRAVAERHAQLLVERDDNFAVRIANAVGKRIFG